MDSQRDDARAGARSQARWRAASDGPAADAVAVPRWALAAVLGPSLAIVFAAIIAERFVRAKPLLQILDNVHWTASYAAAAVLAWLGTRYASPADRVPRRWFALGMSAYAIGQVLWDVQVVIGWNPFPGPSDAFYLLLGPMCGLGLLQALRSRSSIAAQRTAALDVGGLVVAAFAFVLALYLPLQGKNSGLQMAVLVAYPVGLLTAACAGLVLVPTLRLRRDRGWMLFLVALIVDGALWMEWNARTLSGRLDDGSLYNAAFSLTAIALGLGALWWRSEPASSPRWERRYEGMLRLLPLLLVLGASAAVLIAFTFPGMPGTVETVTGWAAAIVVTISLVRQSILLHERDRMLEAESLFRTLFASAQDAILLMNASGFQECNASAERMYGVSRDELCRLGPLDFSPEVQPDGRSSEESAREKIDGAMRGQSQFFSWLHHRRDGTPFYAEVSLDCVSLPSGRVLQAVVRDVTDRHEAEATRQQLEERLRHAARLEAVGRLAGGVAHDFNNILTVIMGTTELALLRTKEASMQKDLGEIRRSAQRAAALTAQLLAFSRKQVIAPVPSDLNSLVAGALVMLRRLIGEDVELVFEPGDAVGTVLVDPTQMEQVLVNLAVNARDVMPGGGRLLITTSMVDVRAADCRPDQDARPGRFVRLQVQDTGPGIPADLAGHVFEPFFTTKEFGRGTGLGLSTVYGIVRQSDGFIDLITEPGRGACFRIHFPEVAMAPHAAPPAVREALRPGREHILLVEDESIVRDLARRVLADLGYQVSVASSGREALEVAAASRLPIDLLLTDVIMPSMSGRELYERMCRERPGLPVVYMSGYTDNVIAPHGVLDPGTNFIQKPFTLAALATMVREVLDLPATRAAGAGARRSA
jgi:PAS domain S-box-containing protein